MATQLQYTYQFSVYFCMEHFTTFRKLWKTYKHHLLSSPLCVMSAHAINTPESVIVFALNSSKYSKELGKKQSVTILRVLSLSVAHFISQVPGFLGTFPFSLNNFLSTSFRAGPGGHVVCFYSPKGIFSLPSFWEDTVCRRAVLS